MRTTQFLRTVIHSMVTPGASACIPKRIKLLFCPGNLVMNLAGRASPTRIDPKKSRGGCRREVQCTAERRPRPHRKGRRRRREQSAWEVFLGFLIFFTVACEQERERERGREWREGAKRESTARIPFEAHPQRRQRPCRPCPTNRRRCIFPGKLLWNYKLRWPARRREQPGSGPSASVRC